MNHTHRLRPAIFSLPVLALRAIVFALLPIVFALLPIALAVLSIATAPKLFAQQMPHSVPAIPAAARSTHLTVQSSDGKTITLSSEDLAALPHKSIVVFNAHSQASETYSGVPLANLLEKIGVPLGESVKGALFMTAVVAEGTDGYKVLFSLAEVDPAFHQGDVIVAHMLDGHKLADDGAFRLVSTEDKRPARWVRNLATISVISVKP